jgi:hypothetical protein
MSSETETLALHLVSALYDAPGGSPQQWQILAEMDGMTAEAIVYAVARGWLLVEAGRSLCLTDAGRRQVESH